MKSGILGTNTSAHLLANANSRFVSVQCGKCSKIGSIRIDQYRRKKAYWECRSCAFSGRVSHRKGEGVKNDPNRIGSYKSYSKAKQRCKINHKGVYKDIEFRFNSFDEWFAELGPRPEGMSVDRIDPRGHYEPGNVRWATHKQQCRNRTNNHLVVYNGVTMCLKDAAKAAGIHRSTLERRLNSGCPEDLLFTKQRWRYKNGKLAEPENINTEP